MRDFLCRFREFTNRSNKQGFEGVRDFLESAHDSINDLLEKIRRENVRFAPRFNIFRALEIERKEVVLHTRLLRHLLDPTASHGQGHLFLRCFFDMMADAHRARFTPPPEPLDDSRWVVSKELDLGGEGRLDLLIENSTKKYVVIIENKIGAGEGDGQLERYEKWVDERRLKYEKVLVFLTPSGRKPDSTSSNRWIRLSYRMDVAKFLDGVLSSEQLKEAQSVREILQQYLLIVKTLSEVGDDDER
jgi:hypothetical protein